MQERDNLVLIILSGIPCSGKSTWAQGMEQYLYMKYEGIPIITISKDAIRAAKFGKDYKINPNSEKLVDTEFFKQLSVAASFREAVVIIDNTHCKEKFLDGYLTTFRSMFLKGKAQIYIKFFEVPLWKAQWRNIIRWIRSGKYIPYGMMKILYRNYHRIDKTKYKHLIPNDF